jgi:RHS repeat-associated protein
MDRSGNLYITGQTYSDFPHTNLIPGTVNGAGDILAIKISPQIDVAPCRGLPDSIAGHENACGYALDGVNTATGNQVWHETDLAVAAPGLPLQWARTYNSQDTHVGLLGQGWSPSYGVHLDGAGSNQITAILEDGAQSVYTGPPDANRVYARPPGEWANLSQEGSGYKLTRPDETVLHFDSQGRLLSEEDRVGRSIELHYVNNVWTSITDVVGRDYEVTVVNGRLTDIRDTRISQNGAPGTPRGVHYDYEGDLLAAVTDLNGNQTHYTYYPNTHLLERITLADGTVRLYNQYDAQGRVRQQQSWNNQPFTVDYDDASAPALVDSTPVVRTQVLELGHETENKTYYDHDAHLDLRRFTDAKSAETRYDYNAAHQRILIDDARRKQTHFDYYPDTGLLHTVVDPMGNGMSITPYPGTSRVQDVVDNKPAPAPHTTHYEYYPATDVRKGLLKLVRDPQGGEMTYDYTSLTVNNKSIQVLSSIADTKGTIHYYYTAGTRPVVGLPLTIDTPDGASVSLTYDGAGRLTDRTEQLVYNPPSSGWVTEHRDYDAADHLLAVIANYQPNQASTADINVTTQYAYDKLGRLIWTQAPGMWKTTWDPLIGGEVTRTFWNTKGQIDFVVAGCTQGGSPSPKDANPPACDPADPNPAHGKTALNRKTVYRYDELGRLYEVTDAAGITTHTVYDYVNRPSEVWQNYVAGGAQTTTQNLLTTYQYYPTGQILQIEDPLHRITKYDYDAAGRPTDETRNVGAVADDTNLVTHWAYTEPGQQAPTDIYTNYSTPGAWDPNYPDRNVRSSIIYDELNRPIRQIAQYVDGSSDSAEYYTDLITQFKYDEVGNRTVIIDPQGRVTMTEYDALHRPTKETHNCTDAAGNPQPNPTAGCAGSHGPDNDRNIVVDLTYTPRGQVATRTDPETQTQVAGPRPYPITATILRRLTTRYSYDALGRLQQQTANDDGAVAPANVVTEYRYTPGGQVQRVTGYTDGTQAVQQLYEYNTAGWLTRQIDPTGVALRFTTDILGQTVVQTDAAGHQTHLRYDPLGQPDQTVINWQNGVVDSTDRADQDLITTLQYDAAGRVHERIAPGAEQGDRHTLYDYDLLDRLVKVTENPTGTYAATPIASQANPAILTINDTNIITCYKYDRRGLITDITDALAEGCGGDPNNRHHFRSYNAAGGLQEQHDNGHPSVTYDYNKLGQLTSVHDARPVTVSYAYDGMARLQQVTATIPANGTVDPLAPITFTYDPAGHRIQMTDGSGQTDYVYDGLARPIQVQQGAYVYYGYDNLGRRTDLRTSNGAPHMVYRYDLAGRLKELHRLNGTADYLYAAATYDNLGRIRTLTRYPEPRLVGTGLRPAPQDPPDPTIVTGYAFDGADRLTRLSTEHVVEDGPVRGTTVIADFQYTLYRDGRAQQATERAIANPRQVTYHYDRLGRLFEAQEQFYGLGGNPPPPAVDYSYQYDKVGNRRDAFKNGQSIYAGHGGPPQYDGANQSTLFTYDAAGNITADPNLVETYRYDALNRLTETTAVNAQQTYQNAYDGDGTLIRQWNGAVATTYTLDSLASLPDRLGASTATAGGSPIVEWYVRGWGQQLTYETAGTPTWYLTDRQGSIRATIDHFGRRNATTNYDPFGSPEAPPQAPNGPVAPQADPTSPFSSYGYTGAPQSSAGLVYLRNRWYHPGQGGFITRDTYLGTLGRPSSLHSYLYGAADPVNSTDPTGQCPWCITGAIGAAAGGLLAYGGQVVQNWDQYGVAAFYTNIDMGEVAGGAVAGGIAGATFGVGTAVIGGLGLTGGAAVATGIAVAGVGGVAAGQAARATANWVDRGDWTRGSRLFDPGDMAGDFATNVLFEGGGRAASAVLGRFVAPVFKRIVSRVRGEAAEVTAGDAAALTGERAALAEADDSLVGPGCTPNSFSADTLVATDHGEQPISTVHLGDHVLAYNQEVGTTGYYTVTALIVNTDTVITHLTIDDEAITTTPEHPFATTERGWVNAGDLRVGEHVRKADGRLGTVRAVAAEQHVQRMYNLTVAGAHTFFVGRQQWLVHNVCNSWTEFQQTYYNIFRRSDDPMGHRTYAAVGWKAYKRARTSNGFQLIGEDADVEEMSTLLGRLGVVHDYLKSVKLEVEGPSVTQVWLDGSIETRKTFILATIPDFDLVGRSFDLPRQLMYLVDNGGYSLRIFSPAEISDNFSSFIHPVGQWRFYNPDIQNARLPLLVPPAR